MGRREVIDLMMRFARRTVRRYLWTDAFAVCNFLGLERATGDGQYEELALRLVDQVHRTLARHRPDDARKGWISGLDEGEAEAHPTRGGLRIGKTLPERGPDDPIDERQEWDRDGQYFHYLTQWMHALDRVALATRQPMFNAWARELADTAHRAFAHSDRGGTRLYWKMSIDLSRPLVASMGQHDPLDGYVTCLELEATAAAMGATPTEPSLAAAAADFSSMIDPRKLATADPLGLGGLLVDAHRLARLLRRRAIPGGQDLLDAILDATLAGMSAFLAHPQLRAPASRRLAFRELGLAIGLGAVDRMREDVSAAGDASGRLSKLAEAVPLKREIESFWLRPENRAVASFCEHLDINEVMLATSLLPDGFLGVDE
jgi:hypothetical protein